MKLFLGAFLVVIGWLMTLGGLLFGILVIGFMTEGKPTLYEKVSVNIIVWLIPIIGLLLVLFSDKIVGYKDKG